MDTTTTSHADEAIICNSCFTKADPIDQFCNNCGYPIKGTEEEQNIFTANKEVIDIDLDDYNKKLKNAANTLYYLSGLFIFWGLADFFIKKDDPEVLAYVLPNIILSILFLTLGAFTRKKPLACLISGICLYVIVQILNMIDNPVNIASGIIIKIAVVGYLIKGIKSAIEVDRIKKENNLN